MKKKSLSQIFLDMKGNKMVLEVEPIEQKVLDATSNEACGPHGFDLADIAHATRNSDHCQRIMSVIWKRTDDTGENWRHVCKALTVLEYLVAHGSESVIDDIRKHACHISKLSDFQYIDSSGIDQGEHVRKKSQSLLLMVNDNERIQEVRQNVANREKLNPYPHSRMTNLCFPFSRGSGAKADDHSQDGRSTCKSLDRKYSGKSFGAHPTREDAVGSTSSSYIGRDEESSLAYASKESYPVGASQTSAKTAAVHPPSHGSQPTSAQSITEHKNKNSQGFDEFDPRGSLSAAPTTDGDSRAASAAEMDLPSSLSFSLNSFAIVPPSPPPTMNNQHFDDQFQSVPLTDCLPIHQQTTDPSNSFNLNSDQILPLQQGHSPPAKTSREAGMIVYSDAINLRKKPSTSAVITNGKAEGFSSGEGHVRRHEPGWMLSFPNFYIGGPGSDAGPALRALGISFPRNDTNTGMNMIGAKDYDKQQNASDN